MYEIWCLILSVPFHYPLMLFFSEPIDLIHSINKSPDSKLLWYTVPDNSDPFSRPPVQVRSAPRILFT